MAATKENAEEVDTMSYWRNVTINFGDGQAPTNYRVDLPTFNKIVAKDPETMKILKSKRALVEIANSCEAEVQESCQPNHSQGAAEAVPKVIEETPSGRKTPKQWGVAETKLLVDIRVGMETLFKNGKKAHKTLWVEVAKRMLEKVKELKLEKTYDLNDEHCCNKWKSLKRAYKDTVDHNAKTGNDPKTCAFQAEFDDLYGNNPATRPQFTVDAMESADSNATGDHGGDDGEFRGKKGVTGRKSREKAPGATLQWLMSYTDNQENKRKERDDAFERRHKDKMVRLDRLLDILDK